MAVYTTIDDAGAYFKTVLYTGTGSSLGVTGVGFQPDFTWIKNRDATDFHVLTDAVRGVTKYIKSDADTAETTNVESLKTFDSDGFTVGTQAEVNTNTEKYVSWNWKVNGAGSLNEVGSINSTASVNTTNGSSIVSWTGTDANATVGHGLGVAPTMIIFKTLGQAEGWPVYTSALGPTKSLKLNTTASPTTTTSMFQDTAPSTTIFSVGANSANKATPMIAYCFADVQGFSKVGGSYEGNADVDGTFVYTGFRPEFVICRTTSGGTWWMFDNKREGYNVNNDPLVAEDTTVEATTDMIDLLSNGFKMRIATDPNKSEPYLYMAFAESPFVNSNGVPTNAR